METYSVNEIYMNLLVHGYTISMVSEVNPNVYLVVMRRGVNTKSVLLRPREQNGQPNNITQTT